MGDAYYRLVDRLLCRVEESGRVQPHSLRPDLRGPCEHANARAQLRAHAPLSKASAVARWGERPCRTGGSSRPLSEVSGGRGGRAPRARTRSPCGARGPRRGRRRRTAPPPPRARGFVDGPPPPSQPGRGIARGGGVRRGSGRSTCALREANQLARPAHKTAVVEALVQSRRATRGRAMPPEQAGGLHGAPCQRTSAALCPTRPHSLLPERAAAKAGRPEGADWVLRATGGGCQQGGRRQPRLRVPKHNGSRVHALNRRRRTSTPVETMSRFGWLYGFALQ